MQYATSKDPDEARGYTIDWSDDLASGETISTSTWTIPAGLTEDSDSNTSTAATVNLSGGTAGEEYIITNEIVTTGVSPARTLQQSRIVPVTEH